MKTKPCQTMSDLRFVDAGQPAPLISSTGSFQTWLFSLSIQHHFLDITEMSSNQFISIRKHFNSETFQFWNISIRKHFNSETFQFGNISILKHFNSHLRPQEAARMQQRQDLPVWIVWVSSSRAWRRPRRHPTRPSNFHISGNNIWRRRKKKQIIFTMTNFSRVLQLFWRGFFTCKYIELFWELCDCNTIDIVVNTNIEIELEFHPRLISMHCCHADDTAIQLGSNRNQVNWSK